MKSTVFQAVTIDVDGTIELVEWDASNGTLEHLQRAVGGLVDVVGLSSDLDMWVNENGIAEGLGWNVVASAIAAMHGRSSQPYFGPAVFTGGADDEGSTMSLTTEQANALSVARQRTLALMD